MIGYYRMRDLFGSCVDHRPTEYVLDSAGEGGFIVSGLTQSDGDGDRFSRFVGSPSNPFVCDIDSARPWLIPVPLPRLFTSTGILFSERNSSRSTYCKIKGNLYHFSSSNLNKWVPTRGDLVYFPS